MVEVKLSTTLIGHQNQIFSAEIDQNANLFTAGNDKGVVQWNLKNMQFYRVLCNVKHSVYSMHHIPDTNLLAIGMRSGEVIIVDYVTTKLWSKFHTEKGAVFSLKTSNKNTELIAIGEEGVAYVFSLEKKILLYRFRVSKDAIRCIAVSEDFNRLYFGDREGHLYYYDGNNYKLNFESQTHGSAVTSLLHLNGHLYSGGRDAKLFKLDQESLSVKIEVVPHLYSIYGIVPSPDGKLIATASRDKSWKIWEADKLTLQKKIAIDRGHDSHALSINTILWNEHQIFTAGDDKTIKIWDVSTNLKTS